VYTVIFSQKKACTEAMFLELVIWNPFNVCIK